MELYRADHAMISGGHFRSHVTPIMERVVPLGGQLTDRPFRHNLSSLPDGPVPRARVCPIYPSSAHAGACHRTSLDGHSPVVPEDPSRYVPPIDVYHAPPPTHALIPYAEPEEPGTGPPDPVVGHAMRPSVPQGISASP